MEGRSDPLTASRRATDPNPPLLHAIEPRIRPLVDALNGTGLVHTFTSCEGHYGYRGSPDDLTDRDRASVGFFGEQGVPEHDLARLFGRILASYELQGSAEAVFTVAKHYAAALDGTDAPEAFFELTVRPRDPRAPSDTKRRITDRALAVVTACVERASRGSRPLPRSRRAA